jgi:rhodanese-related sulfurtransferase
MSGIALVGVLSLLAAAWLLWPRGAPASDARIPVSEAAARVAAGAPLIDVRSPAEYAGGHAAGARNLPLDQLMQRLDELPPEPLIVCQSGARSARAVALLRQAGRPAIDVAGGTSAWRAAGLPMA